MSQNAMEQRKAKPVSVCAHVSEEASHPSLIHVTESPFPILIPHLPALLARSPVSGFSIGSSVSLICVEQSRSAQSRLLLPSVYLSLPSRVPSLSYLSYKMT